jgi:hypothetical protein
MKECSCKETEEKIINGDSIKSFTYSIYIKSSFGDKYKTPLLVCRKCFKPIAGVYTLTEIY